VNRTAFVGTRLQADRAGDFQLGTDPDQVDGKPHPLHPEAVYVRCGKDEPQAGTGCQPRPAGQAASAFSNTGGVTIRYNTIDGNLQCKSNVPAPIGGFNQVSGNKEDQCRRL